MRPTRGTCGRFLLRCNAMASPQVEDGFITLAMELFERLCCVPINGSEFRIILFTLRKTYGFKKKVDWISLTQYQKGTGLPRANVVRTIKCLVANRLLVKSENGSIYGINKDYAQWVVAKRLPGGSSQTDLGVVANWLHTKETITKEINTVAKATKPKMKKNSFRYNENNPDDFEDVVDIETGESVAEKKKLVLPVYKELIEWAEARRRKKFFAGTYTKQYKAFKEAQKNNILPHQLKARWQEMEDDKWWQEKGFDWIQVVYSFSKKPK